MHLQYHPPAFVENNEVIYCAICVWVNERGPTLACKERKEIVCADLLQATIAYGTGRRVARAGKEPRRKIVRHCYKLFRAAIPRARYVRAAKEEECEHMFVTKSESAVLQGKDCFTK